MFIAVQLCFICASVLSLSHGDKCLSFSIGKTLWELVIEQFEDLLVRILLLAACISFVSILRKKILAPSIVRCAVMT